METWRRLGARATAVATIAGTVGAIAVTGWSSARPSAVVLERGSVEQRRLVVWAVERYDAAGLELPQLEVAFHRDPSGCRGNSGYWTPGHLDVCVTDITEYARKVVVHELAHAWCAVSLTPAERGAFLRDRRLTVWSSTAVPWGERGIEQAAEIVAWAIGDRQIPPLLEDDDPVLLAEAYALLTGSGAPTT